MKYILALDQGTTSSRAILFDRKGQIATIAQKEFEQHFPRPGWVEHDPEEIWASQLTVASEAMIRQRIPAREIAAIGITNQRETTVLWDRKTGKALHNAIVWQDRRTSGICDTLREAGHAELIRQKTGLVLDAYFSGTKLQWLLDNVEGARARAEAGELAFGTIDTWLVYRLTGGEAHITDVTNASRTLLFNIHERRWDDDLLELFHIPRSLLPEVRSSSEVYAKTTDDVFSVPIPIAGIAGDQQAALFGQLCIRKSMVKNTYGTGCFMLMNTGEDAILSENKLISTIAWEREGRTEYALEGSVFIGGAVIQWLRDGLKLIRSAPESERLASQVDDTGGVYLVPAFAGLGAPHWDQYARGAMVGMTRGTTSNHIVRAALESIAYQVADVLDAMQEDSGLKIEGLRVDGGAAANNLLLQFQSDILGVPIVRPKVTETTALGAAYLAGLAVGYWNGPGELDALWEVDRQYDPVMDRGRAAELRAGWKKALERAMKWEDA